MEKTALLQRLPEIVLPNEESPEEGAWEQRSAKINKITWHEPAEKEKIMKFMPHSTYDIYDHSTVIREVRACLLDAHGKNLREIQGTRIRHFHESSSHMAPDGWHQGEKVRDVLEQTVDAHYLLIITKKRTEKWSPLVEVSKYVQKRTLFDHSDFEIDIYSFV